MSLASAAQALPLLTWFKLVNDTLPAPYLDEVFHVRQAQHYCQNHWNVWDPKITTPPGLYLLSYLLSPVVGCDLIWLRGVNLLCLTTLETVLAYIYVLRRPHAKDGWTALHSALNITLFPPLFFFAALYYTDVASTLSVVIFYCLFLYFEKYGTSRWLSTPVLVIVGIASLWFRQTNIFWVAVFPAGIVLVHELDQGHAAVKDSMHRYADGFGDSLMSVARTSWKLNAVFDPPVKDAWFEDSIKTLVSLATCSLKLAIHPTHVTTTLAALLPSLTVLTAFSAFILYNGSVVLGDKTNHVATLHLPQMFYIWPYLTFFSWPLTLPYLAAIAFTAIAKIRNLATLPPLLLFKRRNLTPRFRLLAIFTALACVVVHYNTIVHPFTLADNRHYTFYVFRRLTNPVWVKYAVAPLYIITGWSCIAALGARPLDIIPSTPSSVSKGKALKLPDGHNGATTSFVLIWLATTSLQLITAPLVEPRYFILPWIFWRMHVPLQQYTPAQQPKSAPTWKERLASVDHRLWLETVWLLAINAFTGYMFLYRGFAWPQEPGKVQRFMW